MISLIGVSGKKQHGKDTVAKIIQYLTTPEGSNSYTLENYLTDKSSYLYAGNNWKVKQFAGKLKQIVALLIGCEVSQLEDETFKNTPLGEEWGYWYTEFTDDSFFIPAPVIKFYADSKEDLSKQVEVYFSQTGMSDEEEQELKNMECYTLHTPRSILQLLGTEGLRDVVHPNVHVNALFSDYKDFTLVGANDEKKYIGDKWIIPDTRFENEAKAIKDRGGIIIRVNNNRVNSTDTHASEISLDEYQFDYVIENNGTIEELVEEVRKVLKQFEII